MKITNLWIVRLKRIAGMPTFPYFKDLAAAKSYCNSVLSKYGKQKYLDGQDIIHVVNDQIISSVTMDVTGDEIYYSDVHIMHEKKPYIEQ